MEFIEQRRQRLTQLRRLRPQFSEIFDFYDGLYAFLGRHKEAFVSIAPQAAASHFAQGFPLLTAESFTVDAEKLRAFLRGLIAVLRQHGRQGQEDLERIDAALAQGSLEHVPLIGAYAARDRARFATAAETLTCEAAVLEYIIGLACSFALHQAREAGLSAPSGEWHHGYCPLCGSVPVMGEIQGDEGRLNLHCGTCGQSWPGVRRGCSSCGNRDEKTLEYFTAGEEKAYRVNVCRKCDSYLKVVDSREAGLNLPMDLEDVATLHLDLLAQREGFTRGKRDYQSGGAPPADSH
ncbi:formate dehydrogenase accessory protein FdhE [Geoalkalibacter halelectricus]|uniref:Formate dehydrogenase accessory protein FdhE n=1 Tax=Geoalkalibacter halelectricus TaxID=2847045 RepID=A0ABY5ZIB6_9BACT|nr:formate dehydrogenase accessory protein FdhE [Geoalkalibacter halelectricus]MDO3377246.1 formate dehydrogenase accessory protein FdhE [Geoalkalibacter halelectricus]UWZ78885.1 formate dehydrogenase accessory protein FdhE [Geoalkalibacter halelectricus]